MIKKLITILVFLAYKAIGTRIEVDDIYKDITSDYEAKEEYYSVLDALRTYKNKWILELSTRRLKACLMWLVDKKAGVRISSMNWNIEDFKNAIELLWKDRFLFYDGNLILDSANDIIKNDIGGLSFELNSYILLIRYIIPY